MVSSRTRQPCRLGVNVDHVATVREARQTTEPDPVHAALQAEFAGADQIVLHIREDRRHVQERDLKVLRETVQTEINLEMALEEDIIGIALEHQPDRVTFVPERREEVTTEGGLDVISNEERIKDVVQQFQEEDIETNLFIDADRDQLEAARRVGAHGVELHTGPLDEASSVHEREEVISRISESAVVANNLQLFVAAGHGLDYKNVRHVASIPEITELNIGHSIVSRSVFVGFRSAVEEMIDEIREWSR